MTEITKGIEPGGQTKGALRQERATIVSLQNISKLYNGVAAVETISLDVAKGELICLLGPSGCGKTTTLRMVAGFIEPSSGTILIDGQDVTDAPPYRRDTGMVFQSYALFPHLTVEQNVAFGLENIGMAPADRKQRVAQMLELVELPHLARRFPKELSGGQQQRVALARALAMNPAVLLLDEPFSNLDAQLRIRLREELRALIKGINMTTLFVTHDQEEALMLADRVVVMNQGRVEQIGTPAEIYETPATRFVAGFIGWCASVNGVVDDNGNFTAGPFRLSYKGKPGPRTIIIRPEYVKPAKEEAGDRLQARVISTAYCGALCRLRLDVLGQELLMDAHYPFGRSPREGETIEVQLDLDGLREVPENAGLS
ncbi:ABC transporter ATP-binding protein [Bradyrhizobium sp. DOA9]|uniref:ABC transporter ATP-binding protein n=1 Tax=Bradyrhizobium sp. DOA9 TaxID=1126627 RepID=UPI00049992AA|nr:ABC transporter ATP-binding protein [Bradyrhizobium sp. DOA9]GAJ37604.1 sulfate/thiosulfate import ATP-binding protein cysA [Bradyrhizobium sp. DOA9]